jgi:peptidoglycan/LPS O-acetylase OafA/YrhL
MATTASAIAPGRKPQHFMQLDGIRALACITVIVFHEAPLVNLPFFGEIGANALSLFFVLSGFLITGILLRARDDAERGGHSVGGVLRAFYARRFLRIFPLYYLVLVVLVVLGVQTIRDTIGWHVLYLSNFISAINGSYVFPTHFWSLSVEEQFYLGWSAAALFLPRRWIKGIAIGMIAMGPISRLAIYLMTSHKVTATSIPTSCLDMLGVGCLLAILWQEGQASEPLRDRLGRMALSTGLALLALETALQFADRGLKLRVMLWTLPFALIGFWLVDRASRRFTGIGRFLEWRPLVYLGGISYGLYVYHIFVPLAIRGLGIPFPQQRGTLRATLVLVITGLIAALSWHLYEKPLNDQKRRFPYVPKGARERAVPVPKVDLAAS